MRCPGSICVVSCACGFPLLHSLGWEIGVCGGFDGLEELYGRDLLRLESLRQVTEVIWS